MTVWLWLTVVFANFAEALAEGRGRAQADALRSMRTETVAQMQDGTTRPAAELHRGDLVVVEAGEVIPGDGTVVEGIASVDESAITGESAPVIRESGGDRSAVTGGTRVLSDRIVVEITQEPGQSFLDRMIALVEGAERRKTPNEIALNILLAALTLIFVIVVVTLQPFAHYANTDISVTTLVALLVALIPTTIGALLSAIGIAGMDRLVRRNVLALSGRAVEASGDVDVLLLDKTGTITLGNRQASEFVPMPGVSEADLAEVAQLSSLADETPEGRSIVVLAKQYGLREHEMVAAGHASPRFVPFTAQTRMSGVDMNGTMLRKGAADAIEAWVRSEGGTTPIELDRAVDRIAREGGTPLAVARNTQVLGVIYLKDTVKEGMATRFERLRAMGIRTVMVTGDNKLTAAKIAAEAGVDDFLAEATPERKMELIRSEQAEGRLVAMTGDGTNDAPALAQADVGVAMNTGTQAAREAGNMVDLDSNPTKLIEIVEVGKQLLITRGALTTFSIANDVAKYFAILPAIFAFTYAAARPAARPARRPQRHGPGHPLLGDHLGDHLQRADHPAARAARPARRAVPAGRRHRAAAAQPARLRPRRPHRPVHRHQAHRPHRPQPAGGVTAPQRPRLHDLPRHGRRGRQDLSHAAGGARRAGGRARRRHRAARDPRARGDAGPRRGPAGRAAAAGHVPRAPTSPTWTSPPSCGAARSWSSSTSWPIPTRPGLEHEKRYEDIEDLLDAGIDVLSTVNVQHLESLNDQVAELSGARVRETIPDSVLGRADEVVLIDLSPEALLDPPARRQDLQARARRGGAQRLLPHREPRGAARGRAAPGGRGGRGQAAGHRGRRHARGRWPPTCRRPSASACSRWSSPTRARSGSCGARGARPSASAPQLDLLWVSPPGRDPDRRAGAPARRRCASSPRCSAPT